MLCTAMSSGGSDWLRRLRSSKGFPDTDHSDLEHFLSNALLHQIRPETARPYERNELEGNSPTEVPDDNGEIQERDLISNVIAELFHMGECKDLSRIKKKKSCRKQQCPKVCILSANSDAEDLPARRDSVSLPLDSSNIRESKEVGDEAKEVGEEPKEREQEQEQGQKKVEEERGHVDLSAYSQTEVTVIDTSVPSWKFEKTLFKRKNVWKVGDKKAKGSTGSDKKKKNACPDENGGGQKKKLKVDSSSSKHLDGEDCGPKKKKLKKLSDSSKHVDKEKTIVTKPPQGHEQANKTTVANNEEKQDNSGPVQEKRQVDEGSSSVILIKSIPTVNKKNVSGIPKSSVKSMKK